MFLKPYIHVSKFLVLTDLQPSLSPSLLQNWEANKFIVAERCLEMPKDDVVVLKDWLILLVYYVVIFMLLLSMFYNKSLFIVIKLYVFSLFLNDSKF